MMQKIGSPPGAGGGGGFNPYPSGYLYRHYYYGTPIDNDTPTKVPLETIDTDFTDGIEDTVNHWILPGVAGFYECHACLKLENFVNDGRYSAAIIKGVPGSYQCIVRGIIIGRELLNQLSIHVSTISYFTATQHAYLEVWHWDGTNDPLIVANAPNTYLTMSRIR